MCGPVSRLVHRRRRGCRRRMPAGQGFTALSRAGKAEIDWDGTSWVMNEDALESCMEEQDEVDGDGRRSGGRTWSPGGRKDPLPKLATFLGPKTSSMPKQIGKEASYEKQPILVWYLVAGSWYLLCSLQHDTAKVLSLGQKHFSLHSPSPNPRSVHRLGPGQHRHSLNKRQVEGVKKGKKENPSIRGRPRSLTLSHAVCQVVVESHPSRDLARRTRAATKQYTSSSTHLGKSYQTAVSHSLLHWSPARGFVTASEREVRGWETDDDERGRGRERERERRSDGRNKVA